MMRLNAKDVGALADAYLATSTPARSSSDVSEVERLRFVVERAQAVVNTFEEDERLGYRSSARFYALAMLRPAIAALAPPTAKEGSER